MFSWWRVKTRLSNEGTQQIPQKVLRLSREVDECNALPSTCIPCSTELPYHPPYRGLHSFTFRLNVSAFCGTGGAFRGCSGGVQGYYGVLRGYQGVSRVHFVSETAQVELRSGRV